MASGAQQRPRQDAAPATESWVEVSSHPSSSSVSSAGDEIDTTGLRVGNSYAARRRRLHPQYFNNSHTAAAASTARSRPEPTTAAGGTTSSQEEYEESDSEDDHVLTSSTEHMAPSGPVRGQRQFFRAQAAEVDSSDDDDGDDHATALGRRPSEPFRPQPNAFSHPPSHLSHRHSASSAAGQAHPRPSFSQRSQSGIDRRTPEFMSPSYQADNDAALRASLTTLLSCAAAARGRPKECDKEATSGQPTGTQPVELRLIPESELMDAPSPSAAQNVHSATPRSNPPTTSPSPRSQASGDKSKRPSSSSKPARASKKKRLSAAASDESTTLISPTVLTWVVSASMVVLVSVVGFSAGYVIGREVGRQENLASLSDASNASAVADAGGCGSEAARAGGVTLRRLRWGAGIGKTIAA